MEREKVAIFPIADTAKRTKHNVLQEKKNFLQYMKK